MSAFYPRATRRGAALDWVKFDAELARDGSVDPVDKALYAAVASFVDAETRESPVTEEIDTNNIPPWVPTRKRLAECIGKSVDTVDRSTKRLEAYGLLKVHRQPDPTNPRRMLPSEYELLDHHVWDERAAQRAAARAAERANGRPEGGRTGAATPRRTDAATPGRTGAAVKDLEESLEEEQQELAPSARSAGDVRRTTTGSSAHEASSGSAASEKPELPRKRTKLTAAEGQAVAEIEQAVPASLLELLSGTTVPHTFRVAALRELEHRTPGQLADRVARRWVRQGFQSALLAGKGIDNPYAVLQALLRAGECPDAGCEDGSLIDTGANCRACEGREAGRQGKTAAVPVQRSGRPSWECQLCRNPKWAAQEPEPEDRVCRDCNGEAVERCAALAASWSTPHEPGENQ